MGRKIRKSAGKTMRPNFFVFCEGKSEIAYIKFLRAVSRAPIQLISRESDSNISQAYIARCKREYVTTRLDKDFLMFDLDVKGMLEHLRNFKNAILLVSHPCIELWFLLHFEDCRSEISADACNKRMLSCSNNYKKGTLQECEKQILWENMDIAIARAKKLQEYRNPSTTIYKLIECIRQQR